MSFSINIDSYLITVNLNNELVRISDSSFPVNSVNPDTSGRFHKPGETTYYFGSGEFTARCEVYGDGNHKLAEQHHIHEAPAGDYQLFDFNRLLEEQPALEKEFFPGKERGGWDSCQELRTELESRNISGTIFPSQQHESGVNISLWPLNNQTLPIDWFTPRKS